MIFCLSCKKHTNDINLIGKLTSNYKPCISAKCNICKKMKSKFVSVYQITGNGFLSNIFKNITVLNTIFKDNNSRLHFLYNEDVLNIFFLIF